METKDPEDLFEKIADYIIKQVQDNSVLSGFQYIVGYNNIQKIFKEEIEEYINNKIDNMLSEREEVADIQRDEYGFDVVLFTDYAPNYDEKDYIK